MTRRDFLATALALAFAPRRAVPLDVRIAFIGSSTSDAALGARMSYEEARRAAMLLNANVRLVDHTDSSMSAIVLASASGKEDLPVDVPVLTLDQRSGANIFRLLPADPACVAWNDGLEKFGAAQLNDRFRAAYHKPMNAEAWAGWLAVKVIWEAAARARSDRGTELLQYLKSKRATFDGHKGDLLRFDPSGNLVTWQNSASPSLYPCSR